MARQDRKREYVQGLRLLEHHEQNVLHATIKDALQMGAISFDAIKQLVLRRIERRQPRLDLDLYLFLPGTNVATTSAASYMSQLAGGAHYGRPRTALGQPSRNPAPANLPA